MRAPGVSLQKLPLFAWFIFVTAILLLLSLPVLAGILLKTLDPQLYYAWLKNLNFFNLMVFIFKNPYILGFLFYFLYLVKYNFRINLVEIILSLFLIYYASLLIQIIFNYIIVYLDCKFNLLELLEVNTYDYTFDMADRNNIPNDNIPRGSGNPNDVPRIIRYLVTNIAALAVRRPAGRVLSVTIANGANVIFDILSCEEKANYWIDQGNHFARTGRFRGGQEGHGPFEREVNPFEPVPNVTNVSSPTPSLESNQTSKFLGDFHFDFGFIENLFSPVEHTMSLSTLLNVHVVFIFILFIIVVSLVILTLYFYLNLIILFNKEYFLNNIKNKYVLMYVKFVIFKTRIDIAMIGAVNLATLIFIGYVLHYLIVHPIII